MALVLQGCAKKKQAALNVPRPMLSAIEHAEVAQIESIGETLFKKDYFGTAATELLMRRIDPEDYPTMAGWLVSGQGERATVHFYLDADAGLSVLADVTFLPDKSPEIVMQPRRAIAAEELARFNARQTGLNAGMNKCSESFKPIVLGSPDTEYHVYNLATPPDPEDILVGGHSKITVSPDGQTVMSNEPFSKSCLVLDNTPQTLPTEAEIEGLFVTHILGPYPAPTHVFLSLLHEQALYVGTEIGIWAIDKGKITLIERR